MTDAPNRTPRKGAVVIGGAAAAIALAVAVIQPFEGKRNVAYLDPSSIPTSCWGHTGADVVVGRRYSDAECERLLTADVRAHAAPLEACITGPVTAGTFGAMVSFAYNAGPGVVCSKFAPLINAGNSAAACAKLSQYVYSRDRRTGRMVRLPGLISRRAAERALCERDL